MHYYINRLCLCLCKAKSIICKYIKADEELETITRMQGQVFELASVANYIHKCTYVYWGFMKLHYRRLYV